MRIAPLISWILWASLFVAAGCESQSRLECVASDGCEVGFACESGACLELCNTSFDCASRAEECRDGLCHPTSGAECDSDGACADPGPCAFLEEAYCLEGACHYAPRVLGTECED